MKNFLKVIAVVLCIAVIVPMYAFGWENVLTVVTPPTRSTFYEGLDWVMSVSQKPEPYGDLPLDGLVLDYNGDKIIYEKQPRWGPNIFCYSVNDKWVVGDNDVYFVPDEYDVFSALGTVKFCRIKSISVAQLPYDTTYIRGVDWDYNEKGEIVFKNIMLKLDGIKLKVVCTDNYTYYAEVKDGVQWCLASDDYKFHVGRNQICALFAGYETAAIDIDIELESINEVSMTHAQSKVQYTYGDEWRYVRDKIDADFDLSGLSVTAAYNNGTQQVFSYDECPERFSIPEDQEFLPGSNRFTVMFDSKYPVYVSTFLYRYGDVDSDGSVNSNDALLILQHIVGTDKLSDNQLAYADVNDDGRINSADALQILNKSVGLIKLFDAEI